MITLEYVKTYRDEWLRTHERLSRERQALYGRQMPVRVRVKGLLRRQRPADRG